MTANRTDLACKIIDVAAEVLKEILRARAGRSTGLRIRRRAGDIVIRKKKLMSR
jgi:hypothetical protein